MKGFLSYKEKEMRRLVGAVPDATIRAMQQEMTNFLATCTKFISWMEQEKPTPFQPERYKEDHNYMDLAGTQTKTGLDGFYGVELIIDDLHHTEISKDAPITDLYPPVMISDLVVRITDKTPSGKRRFYEVHRYDPEMGLMYFSKYETAPGYMEEVEVKPSVLLADPAKKTEEVWHPAETHFTIGCAIPIQWVICMLAVGMWGKWQDMSFMDYPLFITWQEDESYKLYRNDYRDNWSKLDKIKGPEHSVLAELLECSFGFQRYLIKLTEDREKVEVKRIRQSKGSGQKNPNELAERKRSAIILDKAYTVYSDDPEVVRGLRKIEKCGYRFSVRGHVRHYKSGKTIWIRPFEKNKDKPFRAHRYGQEV